MNPEVAVLVNYGVPALALLLVGKELFGLIRWLVERSNGNKGEGRNDIHYLGKRVVELQAGVDRVVERCEKTDQDGVPMMYMPRRVVAAVEEQTKHLYSLLGLMEQVVGRLDILCAKIDSLTKELRRE